MGPEANEGGRAPAPMPIIVGYPRSGTTLLRLMFDAHPEVAIPPETGFLPEIAALGDDAGPGAVWELITGHESWSTMKLDADELRDRLQRLQPFSAAAGARAFYELYAERFGKPRYGDKTPYYLGAMGPIGELLPEAHFIHMIRDGRDTAVSIRGLWFSPGDDAMTLARTWSARIENARRQSGHLASYTEVRYEDLVADPEAELRRVCEPLHLEFSPRMLRHAEEAPARLAEMTPEGMMEREDEEVPEVIRFARRPADPSRVGRWREALSSREVTTYEAFAGGTLERCGYALTTGAVGRGIANIRARLSAFWSGVGRGERLGLAAACALTAVISVLYTALTSPNALGGDQSLYHEMGVYFTEGKLWWSEAPYGIPHASAWKAPIYPAWVGFWYELLGISPTRLAVVQGLLLAPLTVLLTWLLGRRLFGPKVGLLAAFVIAVFPFSWEYIALLYPEALAIPLSVAAMLVFLDREPTRGVALATGGLIGACMLVRPNSFFLFAGALVSWWVIAGGRRAIKMTAVAVAVAVLMILPWTVRNAFTADGFVPISIQDAAVYGTFNETAANDDRFPYAWRAIIDPMPEVFDEPGTSDAELRRRLIDEAADYIRENPMSLLEVYFWNGIVRFWDIQRPANVEHGIEGSGRTKLTGFTGFALYWLLVPPALVTLWRLRRRPAVLYALLAAVLVVSITVMPDSTTRYRAPLEPVIAILAAATLVRAPDAVRRLAAASPRSRARPAAPP